MFCYGNIHVFVSTNCHFCIVQVVEQNLLLQLESDELFAVAYETRQNCVSDTFESKFPA